MTSRNIFLLLIILLLGGVVYLLINNYYRKDSATFKNINPYACAAGFISLLALIFYGSRRLSKQLDSNSDFKISVIAFDGGKVSHFTQEAFTRKSLWFI